jgi:hypothetical protein
MKVCEVCGNEFGGLDGDNTCRACEDLADSGHKKALAKRRAARRANDAALRSCGLVKVRGALGGTYWE